MLAVPSFFDDLIQHHITPPVYLFAIGLLSSVHFAFILSNQLFYQLDIDIFS